VHKNPAGDSQPSPIPVRGQQTGLFQVYRAKASAASRIQDGDFFPLIRNSRNYDSYVILRHYPNCGSTGFSIKISIIPKSLSPILYLLHMPNAFDPYREALVIEQTTIWPDSLENPPTTPADRERIETLLHADPAKAAELAYIRLHTGFCRQITVTAEDMERLE
jgi:hypothetical protein